jgi:hypothetical protein
VLSWWTYRCHLIAPLDIENAKESGHGLIVCVPFEKAIKPTPLVHSIFGENKRIRKVSK